MMRVLPSVVCLGCVASAYAGGGGVAGTIAHQGVVAVHGERFTGQGEFRFALVDTETQNYLWVNDGSAVANPDAPASAASLPVINGIYNVRLGDAATENMTAIPLALFHDNDNVALRIWFDDGVNDSHQLVPDQPIASVPFAYHSATIDDNAVTSAKIVDGQVENDDLANNAVNSAKIQNGTVSAADLATNSVGSDEIANSSVTASDLANDAASLNRVSGGTIWSIGGNMGVGTANPSEALTLGDSRNIQMGATDGAGGALFFRRVNSVEPIEPPANGASVYYNHDGSGGEKLVLNLAGSETVVFGSNGNVGMSGNVGIGTASRDEALTLGDSRNIQIGVTDGAGGALFLRRINSAAPIDPPANGASIYYNQDGSGREKLVLNLAGSERAVFRNDGNVGIGTAAPNYMLHVNGSAGKPSGEHWSVPSDRRLKKNIQRLHDVLDRVLALQGVTFEFRNPGKIKGLSGEQVGFVAQDVEQVFPEWVDEDPTGFKRVTVRGDTALLVEALRELRNEKNAQIAAQGAEISALRKRLEQLEAKIRG